MILYGLKIALKMHICLGVYDLSMPLIKEQHYTLMVSFSDTQTTYSQITRQKQAKAYVSKDHITVYSVDGTITPMKTIHI